MTEKTARETAAKTRKKAALSTDGEQPKKKGTGRAKKKPAAPPPTERDMERASLEKVWSRKDALEGLKRIFETALEGARIEIRDEEGALREVKFNPSAANAATKAVETANRMLGYTTPNEDGEDPCDGDITVDLGDAEEFAL